METKSGKPFPPVRDILPFEDRVRVFDMPAVRFIGKSILDTLFNDPPAAPAFWKDFFAQGHDGPLASLPHVLPGLMAWVGAYTPETKQYAYMICVACPAETPVPEGYEHRDAPAGLLAQGRLGVDVEAAENDEALAAMGLARRDDGWCGEFYPNVDAPVFCWVFPAARAIKKPHVF